MDMVGMKNPSFMINISSSMNYIGNSEDWQFDTGEPIEQQFEEVI